ncbi:hypothetical protein T09_4733 [Trichinella sp. T9]|nr:hypothetical protein T09_4733 [Trichinella sp. T9]
MDTNEHRLITTQKPTTFAHTTVRRSLTKTAAFITSSSLTYRTPTTVLMKGNVHINVSNSRKPTTLHHTVVCTEELHVNLLASQVPSWLTFIGNKQETRYCYDMRKRQERRYCYYIKAENIDDKDDSLMLFQGPSLRLAVARTERELKHSFEVVSRGKAVYNETPVESIPEEG